LSTPSLDKVAAELEAAHKRIRTPLLRYLREARLAAVLTAPVIYGCIVPFLFVDLAVTTYQSICFPVYGIPKVSRKEYLLFDRGKLRYLNALERLNCRYCSYANGLIGYVREVLARTEQHWCPIRHASKVPRPHDRYNHFIQYGDAPAYRQKIETVRNDFTDISKD
jgi:hypothetical protein